MQSAQKCTAVENWSLLQSMYCTVKNNHGFTHLQPFYPYKGHEFHGAVIHAPGRLNPGQVTVTLPSFIVVSIDLISSWMCYLNPFVRKICLHFICLLVHVFCTARNLPSVQDVC